MGSLPKQAARPRDGQTHGSPGLDAHPPRAARPTVIRLPYQSVFRELLRRELGERYRGTLLGGGWYLVLPLLQLGVLAWVFGSLLPARANSSVPYPVFLALGLWPWTLFANAASHSATVAWSLSDSKRKYFTSLAKNDPLQESPFEIELA